MNRDATKRNRRTRHDERRELTFTCALVLPLVAERSLARRIGAFQWSLGAQVDRLVGRFNVFPFRNRKRLSGEAG